jgi:heme-degrading monooxygenase HmoA
MFTRVVKLTCKPGQTKQACKNMNDKVLPILKKQQGFMDETILVSTNDPDHVLALSFWNTREDAERYNRDQFPKIRDMMQDVLASPPAVETYDVDTSTTHRITSGKAA